MEDLVLYTVYHGQLANGSARRMKVGDHIGTARPVEAGDQIRIARPMEVGDQIGIA